MIHQEELLARAHHLVDSSAYATLEKAYIKAAEGADVRALMHLSTESLPNKDVSID